MEANTLEDIFNDPEFKDIFDFEAEKKEIESHGWNYKDIQEMAKFVVKTESKLKSKKWNQ